MNGENQRTKVTHSMKKAKQTRVYYRIKRFWWSTKDVIIASPRPACSALLYCCDKKGKNFLKTC